ncbi:MAG: alpha-amylase family glycosyl hydrolase [Propionibacterium sp.]|nr:alpha-amylase family glycosyl hydrolase [Propionibacterium sp.]
MPSNKYQPIPFVRVSHPEWTANATIYQINTRQFTQEGTFRAAESELTRLKDLGVDILWIMPIHPIGEVNRKGRLGSPYAVKDYFGVNAELGTLDDLRAFVTAAHELGMHVILDWVANHTAWDNPLTTEHPEWYLRDWKGDFCPTPWWDWDDIIDLDYHDPALREYMTGALSYWVREADIDGYRCDVAGFVPVDFWETARAELEKIKPIFMLAEWESKELHAGAFDMTYSWHWNDTVHRICGGLLDCSALEVYYAWNSKFWPPEAQRMLFVSNHDKNAWEGTEFEQFGDGLQAAMVLSVISEGMPLVYNGQEAGYDKRLSFFERDPIEWRDHPNGELYRRLFALKHANTALRNAPWGARMVRVPNSAKATVLSFVRRNDTDKVFAVFNFSPDAVATTFADSLFHGTYRDYFSGDSVELGEDLVLDLEPWDYRVFVQ